MGDDAEFQLFRSGVNCAAVLEGMVWPATITTSSVN
jgi:hypothetical protein